MKAKIHYAVTDNPSSSICGRFSKSRTRIVGCVTCKDCKVAIKSKYASLAQFVKPEENSHKEIHLARVHYIQAAAEKECKGCEFQDGKHCDWWKKKTDSPPPCQQHKPDEKLTTGYFNFSPVHDLSDNEMLAPFFSSFACQTCGSTLAGNRHYCSATIGKAHANPREKLEICDNCFEYFF